MNRSLTIGVFIFFMLAYFVQVSPIVRAADVTAPDITNVSIFEVDETSVTITWETDEDSDSTVNYGLKEDYGIVRIPEADKVQHTVTIDSLEPGRTYYFRVVSSDEVGNQGISANYKVVTDGTPQAGAEAGEGKETQTETEQTVQSESETTQEIIEQIQQLESVESLQEVLEETVEAIQGITDDLQTVGPLPVIPEPPSQPVI